MAIELTHSKIVFRLESLSDLEQKMWKKNWEQVGGCYVDDPRDFFIPLDGESNRFLNHEIGTRELKVRRWKWTDDNGIIHELLDLSSFDDEFGIIALDGDPLFEIDDSELKWWSKTHPELATHVEFFTSLRIFIDNPFLSQLEAARKSSDVAKSIDIEIAARRKYKEEIKAIKQKAHHLEKQFWTEFEVIPPPGTIELLQKDAEELLRKESYWLSTFPNSKGPEFVFIKWRNPETSSDHILMHVIYNDDTKTYLLDKNGKIGPKIYNDFFTVEGPLFSIFRPRIHSFMAIVVK